MKRGIYEGIYLILACSLLAKVFVDAKRSSKNRTSPVMNNNNNTNNDIRKKHNKKNSTPLLIKLLRKLHINKVDRATYLFHFTSAVSLATPTDGDQPLTPKDFVKIYTYSVLISEGFIPQVQRVAYFDRDGTWRNETESTWMKKPTGSMHMVVYQFAKNNGLLILWDIERRATSTILFNLNAINVEIRNDERDIGHMFFISTLLKSRRYPLKSSSSLSIIK